MMKKKIEKVKPEDIVIYWTRAHTLAQWRYEAFYHSCPCPVGIAYVTALGTQNKKSLALIMYLMVFKNYRRMGIGTLIHKTIKSHFNILITDGTTKEGMAFIKKEGYKFSKELDTHFVYGKK